MKRLAIYHPGSGTLIPLTDKAYLVNLEIQTPEMLQAMESGATVYEWDHRGFRLDDYNMTNLFYE
jgi:hypothetical protein